MMDDKEVEECARKTLGLDEEPNVHTPTFYLEAFQHYVTTFPYDTHFIIELADPTRKGGDSIGGNGFGVITCMEDYCWKDVILSADPLKIDGGKQDGFGSFSDYQDHCNEPDHIRGRSERCKRLGINDQPEPSTSSTSSSLLSSSSIPHPQPFEYPSTSSSTLRHPLPFEYPSTSSSSSSSARVTSPTQYPRKSSILDQPALAVPLSSTSTNLNNTTSGTSSRAIPLSSPPSRNAEPKPNSTSFSSPPRSTMDIKPIPPRYNAIASSSSGHRHPSVDIITISSSSPIPSDDEYDELEEEFDDDDDDDGVIPLGDDEIPEKYKKITNENNPILLTDSESDDGEIPIKDVGKGKSVARSNSNRIPLAPIFTLSQSNRNNQSKANDKEGGIEMVRDDSGSSIGEKQKSFDALFSPNTSQSKDKGKNKEVKSEPTRIQALSAEEKLKLMEEAHKPTPPPVSVVGDMKPNTNGPVQPLIAPKTWPNLTYYSMEERYLHSPIVQSHCIRNHNLSLLVNGRQRVLEILKQASSSREYFPPSASLLTLLPSLRPLGPPPVLQNPAAGPSSQPSITPVVNGQHDGYAGPIMPGGWNPGLPIGAVPNPMLSGMIPAGEEDDLSMSDIYGRLEEFDRPRTDAALHSYFDENMKDFVEDTTVDESLRKLGLLSILDRLPDLNISLMPHQVLGVDFMLEKEKEKKFLGGINADAMGLGKTVQSIATIASNQSQDPKIKTTLIVAPLALLRQWKNEIESKTTAGLFKVLIHHGPKRNKSNHHLKTFDVVLTTYGTLVAESGPKPTRAKKNGSDDEEEYTDVKKLGPLLKVHWYRVILDEAHQIRNRNTRASKACFALKSYLRWCLTGTPIVNTLDDVYPYLRFLGISPSARWETFRDHISRVQKRRPKLATKRMQAILRQCCIRRHKDSELNGEKLLKLPPKTTNVVTMKFTEDERQIYAAIEGKFQVRFNSYLKKGTVMKHYSVVLVMLLRLRQLTCHPWLLRRNPNDQSRHHDDVLVTDEDLMSGVEAVKTDDVAEVARAATLCGQEVVDRIKKVLAERDSETDEAAAAQEVECSICYESPMMDERITPCAHSYCSTCIAEHFNNPAMDPDLTDVDIQNGRRKCPMCRGLIERGKIFRADAFRPHNEEDDESEMAEEDGIEDDIEAKLEPGDEEEYEEGDRKGKRKATGDVKPGLAKKKKGVIQNINGEDALADVADELAMEDVLPSTKMKKLGELINDVANCKETKDQKIIVFSQFVQYIELCSLFLTRRGVNHVRYIGAMNQEEREDVLKRFDKPIAKDPNAPKVILMSLKCGGVGLNLCAANHVICLDLAWNAATENQAVDRAHRIGQQEAVYVHRLVIENTVEQRIMQLQEEKQALSDGAMGEGAGGRLGRLSVRDLMRLFAVNGDGED